MSNSTKTGLVARIARVMSEMNYVSARIVDRNLGQSITTNSFRSGR